MNFYQEVVADYIAADRKTFVSPEYDIRLPNGPEFWIDVVAVTPSLKTCYLCEVTFSSNLRKICTKLHDFEVLKADLKVFLATQAGIPHEWELRPWLFINQSAGSKLLQRLRPNCEPKITYLEYVAPWHYPNGYRSEEPGKPYPDLPLEFQ